MLFYVLNYVRSTEKWHKKQSRALSNVINMSNRPIVGSSI